MLSKSIVKRFARSKLILLFFGIAIFVLVTAVVPGRHEEQAYHWSREKDIGPAGAHASVSVSPEKIMSILKKVHDPEIPINIVDLGLVYDVGVEGGDVTVTMTVTTPKCPMAGELIEKVKAAVFSHPAVQSLGLRLTFDPPWSVDRASPGARDKLFGVTTGAAQ